MQTTLSTYNRVTEITVQYKNPLKPSEMPQIKSSTQLEETFRPFFSDCIEHHEEFYIMLLNRASRYLGVSNLNYLIIIATAHVFRVLMLYICKTLRKEQMKNKLKRYFWLVDTLKGRPMSLNELSRKWKTSSLNDDGTPLSRRTFQEHRNAINELEIGIQISYDYVNSCYELVSDDDNGSLAARWMWNAMSLQSTIKQSTNIKNRIVIDEIPSAQIHLETILQAIKENCLIEFTYHPFRKEAFSLKLHPYFVQLTEHRWYVYGVNPKEEKIKIYALDRIKSIKLQEETFVLPEDFSPEEYLQENGIGQYENIPIMDVVIRAYNMQVDRLRTLPLHPSQQETKTEENKSEFTYRLRPNSKFVGDILSMGKYVKVLSPYYVRKQLKETIDKLLTYYK
ncbi:WYL domain-containing protein [Bacteroidales bacterium OttesenSCG-928-M06]|nr:WYL domain-containing protein [Bacteroidales bacterium OttesenSCG-928-M06]